MSNKELFTEIINYIDNLHRDIGQMVLLIEQSMEENNYRSPMGGRASGEITSHYTKPEGWRIPYIYRLFIPVDPSVTTYSIFYLVMLQTDSAFNFPPIICAKVNHPPFTESEVSSQIVWGINVRSLARKESSWSKFQVENGWSIAATPKHNTQVVSVQGYILNLFDMTDQQRVIDNIVTPLINPDRNLDDMRTVDKYVFPPLEIGNEPDNT